MYKFTTAFFIFLFSFCNHTSATVKLFALIDAGNPMVTLRWNMVDYPGNTAYVLYKSADGVIWETAAANPVFRNYTASTILAYRDHFSDEEKLFYRVKVYDGNENVVEVSNTTAVSNPVEERYRVRKQSNDVEEQPSKNTTDEDETPSSNTGDAWQIAPNPVHDMLNLNYTGKAKIKDVINVIIQDATGKAVIKFRAASNNSRLHIPVSNLHAGVYFIKINVATRAQLNSKFVKD